MILLLATVPAHAADLFSPVPGDMSMKLFVKPLFGPVVARGNGRCRIDRQSFLRT
ncbi:hypothetical protein [Burkholderia vietnamiensis]|uniref:hypothetical protein n=1 Tax=Burkholderia vietnamiensis TaxID=60552 RepID=UPI000B14D560|nr:hypothetical protein [Burkholderia vietnamiensis]MDN7924688.1 hypothetical protein [Burkholderia vietnamiensis]HDR9249733.1 hypothetical protein [Burkholderia vietnamiensis]